MKWRSFCGGMAYEGSMVGRALYAGFTNGKLDWLEIDDGFGGTNWRKAPAIFKGREACRVQYQDVRKVELKISPKKRRTKGKRQ